LFVLLEFSESEIAVSIGPDCPTEMRLVSELWSHTVYELENLAMGLRCVALNKLPRLKVKSRDMLIGPTVSLWTGLQFQLGHPGIGVAGRGTMIYCSIKARRAAGRSLIHLEAMNDFRSERAVFEVEEVLAIAEVLYAKAKSLAPRFISDGDAEVSDD